MYRILVFVVSMLVLLAAGCKKSPTPPNFPPKSPRKYTWTVDTLRFTGAGAFQTAMRAIWGSSPQDVYVAGHNSNPKSKMYHYDGTAWIPVNLWPDVIQGAHSFSAIFGFSSDDIWVVGSRAIPNPSPPPNFFHKSLIVHYDGNQWQEIESFHNSWLYDVWGPSSGNVYIVGDSGLVLNQKEGKWDTTYIAPFALVSVGGSSEATFVAGVTDSIISIYTENNGQWDLAEKQSRPEYLASARFGITDFYSPSPGIYYSVGAGIFLKKENSWEKVLDVGKTLDTIFGTGQDNIIAVGVYGAAYHWNGTDWAALNLPEERYPADIWFTGVWMTETDVFICGHDVNGYQTFVLHGK